MTNFSMVTCRHLLARADPSPSPTVAWTVIAATWAVATISWGVLRDSGDGLIGRRPPLLADADTIEVEHTVEEHADESQLSEERPADDPPMDFMLVLMALSGRRPVTPCEQMVESSSHSSSRTMMLESRWAEVMA